MKSFRKWNAHMLIMILLLGLVAVPGGGVQTVEAASKNVTVKKVTCVDSLTGSKTIYLAKGKKATLKTTVTVKPDKSANKKVTYKSSNKKVATVTSKGVITGKKVGTAKITVTSKKNSKKKVMVTVKVVKGKVTGIQLNKTSATLTIGDSDKLTATVKTSKGGKKNVVWTTSDEKVATVRKGNVKAVGVGTATITVKAADGTGKKAICKVTVKDKEEGTTQAPTTEAPTPQEPTTETPKPEEPRFVLKNTEGKNASDVAVVRKMLEENKISDESCFDLNDTYMYTWNAEGRLTGLKCYNSDEEPLELSSLDVSRCSALTYLDCCGAGLSNLDVSKNTALKELDCSYNQLSNLDVSKNIALEELVCDRNQLSSLDVSKNTALKVLHCNDNQLSSLDVSKNTALKGLYCNDNQLSSLDISKNTALRVLEYNEDKVTLIGEKPIPPRLVLQNTEGKAPSDVAVIQKIIDNIHIDEYAYDYDYDDVVIDLNNIYGIEWNEYGRLVRLNVASLAGGLKAYGLSLYSLDVSGCTALTELNCGEHSGVKSLNASGCATLTKLFCEDNSYLSSLNASNCTALTELNCSSRYDDYFGGQLSSLDVSGCIALTDLDCSNNQLSSLDVSGCTALVSLSCDYNQLSSLDVSKCTALRFLYCYENQLSSLDVTNCTKLIRLGYDEDKVTVTGYPR